ncbi:unnamed protein product [Cylicocyclus nassatus]|uniref:Uncharacterized protein n=1 Tax=Cylicocyclus nassatus TaxID=53992 RepID=A0AA36ME76_CYLNA|nr:unnamed protein product [Cylicocyclus nassatus]
MFLGRDAREGYCSRCRRKKRSSLVSLTETHESKKPMAKEIQSQNVIDARTAVVQTRRNSPRKAVQDVSNHKITDFFLVLQSSRKTGKQLEEEKKYALRDAITI